MRLYEFTNPSEYLLPETDAADLVEQSKNVQTVDTTDNANPRSKKKPETKKPTETL